MWITQLLCAMGETVQSSREAEQLMLVVSHTTSLSCRRYGTVSSVAILAVGYVVLGLGNGSCRHLSYHQFPLCDHRYYARMRQRVLDS